MGSPHLPDEVRDGKSGSEWEAIAADGKGRVFIVKESSLTVIVLSRSFDKHVHTIELDVEDGPDEDARQLLNDENAGPEGILLLEAGRLLAVKQKDPALLIEFGLPHSRSRPFKARSHLRREHHFELSKGPRTRLVPLRSWRLRDESNKDLESVNDLAADRNTVYAISSRSRCIFELPLRSNNAKAVVAQHRWRLPDEMELSGERKAEGLTFDRKGHPIVAIDSKDKDENVFLLEPLSPARD